MPAPDADKRVEAELRAKAAQAGIAIPDERLADVVAGAGRLDEAMLHIRRFLADLPPDRP